jgi:hypothetical protein
METNSSQIITSPFRLPSWLLSVALHLTLFILFALFVRSNPTVGIGESDRPIGIALAQVDTDSIEYVDADDMDPSNTVDSSAVTPDARPQIPNATDLSQLNAGLPELPGDPALDLPVESLVAAPQLSKLGKPRLAAGQGVADILAEEAARRKSLSQIGPPAQVSLFGGASAEGRSFLFVIDRSQSMGSGGLGVLRLAKREFKTALASLKPTHKFQVLAYNHVRVLFGDEQMLPATETNKQLIDQFMGGLASFGATNHYMAITSALSRKPDVIFLLTDGADPELDAAKLAQIRKRAGGRTSIHCLQFGARPWGGNENFMQRLAHQNNGTFQYIDVSRLPAS